MSHRESEQITKQALYCYRNGTGRDKKMWPDKPAPLIQRNVTAASEGALPTHFPMRRAPRKLNMNCSRLSQSQIKFHELKIWGQTRKSPKYLLWKCEAYPDSDPQMAGSEVSDPDPDPQMAWSEISDPDPDPAIDGSGPVGSGSVDPNFKIKPCV
jgi:hypothetical protein